MRLAEIVNEVNGLRELPADDRRDAVARLLPHLEQLAADPAVVEQTRVNTIIKALRAISPRAPRPDDVDAAITALRQAVATGRGPGRPPMGLGPPTTVRLTIEAYEWLDELAISRGYVDRDGEPIRAAIIRDIIRAARISGAFIDTPR